MAKRSGGVPLVVSLDGRAGKRLQGQLDEGLRAAILGGRVQSGQRLPSTRSLAKDLAVSRNTVAGVFGQLVAEGYAEARVGSGTVVARALPENFTRIAAPPDIKRGNGVAHPPPPGSHPWRPLAAARVGFGCAALPPLLPRVAAPHLVPP